jgi:hypothetical protein
MRRADISHSVAADVAVPHVIDEDDDDVRLAGGGQGVEKREHQESQPGQQTPPRTTGDRPDG